VGWYTLYAWGMMRVEFRRDSPKQDWHFPFKLPTHGAENPERIYLYAVLLRLLKELGVELVDELRAATTLAITISMGCSCEVPPCRPRPRLRATRPPFIARIRRIKARRNKGAVGRRGGGEERTERREPLGVEGVVAVARPADDMTASLLGCMEAVWRC
jgi:hypothetical protein